MVYAAWAEAGVDRAAPDPVPPNHTYANDNAGYSPVKLMVGPRERENYYEIYLFPNRKAIAISTMAVN